MALIRRGKSKVWYVDIVAPNGQRYRESTKTENKQLANEFHDRMKTRLWEEVRLGKKAPVLFSVAVAKLLAEKAGKVVAEEYERQLGWWQNKLDERFPDGAYLHLITKEVIAELIAKKEAEASKATCNRYMAALKVCLRLAANKWSLIDEVPYFFMNKEGKGRTRYLKPDEIARLLAELPEHLVPPTVVALSTGLRRSRCIGLRWEQVDLCRKVLLIDGDEMKNGEDLGIPLSETAYEAIKAQVGKHPTQVFTYLGRGFDRPGTKTWAEALERAGIEDFHWHDLRHTWASMMVQAGVSDAVLMKLGGWKTAKMVRRYAHHETEALRPYAQVADKALQGLTLVTTQIRHKPPSDSNVYELRKVA